MTAHQRIFGSERAKAIQEAFTEWYESIPRGQRDVVMGSIGGRDTKIAQRYTSGARTPHPDVMRMLFLKTQNPVFRMTREEKDRHSRLHPNNPFQDDKVLWPDLEVDAAAPQPPPEVGELKAVPEPEAPQPIVPPPKEEMELEPVRKLVQEFKRLTAEIKKYADLPEGDPKREEARKLLAGPAMTLFNSAFKMKLEFPEAFQHILDTMAMAAGKF